MKVGFIGLGNIGNPMAGQVLGAGHALVVHDLARAAAENLLAEGAGWADSPRAAATGAEVVMTSLPSPTAVEAVMAGPEGALAGLAAGAAWIDLTTNDQAVLKRLAARAAEAGVATLDAPVTGGVLRARRGALTVLVGGEAAVFAAHRPLLEAIGTEVIHLGPLGDATVAKLITNQLCFIHTVALGEGLMLGAKAGLALGPLWEAIKASYGNSFVAEVDGPPILHGDRTVVFALALAAKDLRLTMELGRALDVPLALTALVEQITTRARATYGADANWLDVVRLIEDATGTLLRAPEVAAPAA